MTTCNTIQARTTRRLDVSPHNVNPQEALLLRVGLNEVPELLPPYNTHTLVAAWSTCSVQKRWVRENCTPNVPSVIICTIKMVARMATMIE